jgi:hypothetical protein
LRVFSKIERQDFKIRALLGLLCKKQMRISLNNKKQLTKGLRRLKVESCIMTGPQYLLLKFQVERVSCDVQSESGACGMKIVSRDGTERTCATSRLAGGRMLNEWEWGMAIGRMLVVDGLFTAPRH